MDLINVVVSSGSSCAVLLVVGWLCRKLIVTRLQSSVAHEFNVKLEQMSSDLRASEERLRSALATKEAEIRALREGAMTAMISRQVAVDKRRLEAADQIWASVVSLNQARAASRWLRSIRLEVLSREAHSNPRVLDFLEALPIKLDLKALRSDANSARPFVTPMVWATYSAYSAVCTHSPMVADAIKKGVDIERFFKLQPMRDLIATALPEEASAVATVEEHSLFDVFIEPLERRLLTELRLMLDGHGQDKERVQQAAAVLAAAENAQASVSQQRAGPEVPDKLQIKPIR